MSDCCRKVTQRKKEDALQTYTHLAVGAFVGGLFFPHEPIAVAACCAGAVAPDVVAATFYTADIVKKKPLNINPRNIIALLAISHSLLLQVGLIIASLFLQKQAQSTVLAFAIGATSHQLLDAVTHVDERYRASDPGFLWPLRWRLQSLIGWQDYRSYPFSIFRLKRFEKVTLGLALAGIILLLL